jgi:hypothetical protein
MNWMGVINHKYEQWPTSYTNNIHSETWDSESKYQVSYSTYQAGVASSWSTAIVCRMTWYEVSEKEFPWSEKYKYATSTDSDSQEDKICGISARLDSTATYDISIHTHTHNITYYLLVERYIQQICGGFMMLMIKTLTKQKNHW